LLLFDWSRLRRGQQDFSSCQTTIHLADCGTGNLTHWLMCKKGTNAHKLKLAGIRCITSALPLRLLLPLKAFYSNINQRFFWLKLYRLIISTTVSRRICRRKLYLVDNTLSFSQSATCSVPWQQPNRTANSIFWR